MTLLFVSFFGLNRDGAREIRVCLSVAMFGAWCLGSYKGLKVLHPCCSLIVRSQTNPDVQKFSL